MKLNKKEKKSKGTKSVVLGQLEESDKRKLKKKNYYCIEERNRKEQR